MNSNNDNSKPITIDRNTILHVCMMNGHIKVVYGKSAKDLKEVIAKIESINDVPFIEEEQPQTL